MQLSFSIQSKQKQDFVQKFFSKCEGKWRSQRRYYTLKQENEPEEVTSILKIEYLPHDATELIALAKLHNLDSSFSLWCGSKVSWESSYTNKHRSAIQGSTIFGVHRSTMYRDRGFATPKPVTATFNFLNSRTMVLRTEYNNSVFEEEIKLIGDSYRTRQTIISKAGEEIMIGQYLENRLL